MDLRRFLSGFATVSLMKSTLRLFLACAVTLAVCLPLAPRAFADEGPLENTQPKGITPDEIIQRFAAKEGQFKQARELYTYRQSITVRTLDGDTTTGEYQEVYDVIFNDQGARVENVVFAPPSTLENGGISMSEEDLDDMRHLMPFVLTSEEIPEYDILYVGQQQEDELHCYVFDIAPKKIEGKKRYFQGRIWVDDHDFQIVKTYGKSVPDITKKGQENLFPKFTTWRQQVDGKYWFPAFTRADDVLHFRTGDVHIREIIKYEDYKQFGSKVRITYEGKEVPKADQTGKPAATPDQQK